ncbi:MAG: tetratricopeptide repeat protein [Acidobacteriaceae bacterium]
MLRKQIFRFLLFTSCFTVAANAQTFNVGGSSNAPKKGKSEAPAQAGPSGFGTSIGVARLARGANDALKHGNPVLAATYAKQATEAAPGNPQLWFLYGYSARLASKLNESEQAYLRGLKLQPGAPDGLSGLAQTYDKMGRVEDAKRLLLQVVNSHPERTNDMLLAGELFMRTNDLQRGLSILQRAEAKRPSAHSELLMAIAYMKLKQPDKAKEMVAKARRVDPRNTDIFRAVATYQREEKDFPGAIATLKSAPAQKPDVLADLAYTYELAGNMKASAATWARVAGMDPRNIGYQLNAGQAQLRLNDLAKAKQYVQRAAAIDPDQYRVHALKAAIARQEKRPQDAIREFKLALARMPEAVPEGLLYPIQLRLNLAELLKATGQDAEAKQQVALAEQQVSKLQIEGPARAEFLRVRASIRASDDTPESLRAAEQDLQDAMKLDPKNTLIELQYANLLWREKRPREAQKLFQAVLAADPHNRFALEGMGYLMRDENNIAAAERYFRTLATDYPDDFVPYLALGDMYTSLHRYQDALAQYDKGYALQRDNAPLIANAANAALELHKIDLAKTWLDRSTPEMDADVRIMRERERYLFYRGDYNRSAELGYAVLKQLPEDRNASVYLAYDLYDMGRRDDVLALASKYENIIPYEPNFPLLEGHVHRQSQLLDQAVDDYTRAIARDKNMVEAYVNRGYVYNDQQNAVAALKDFDQALKLQPENGTAFLGRSFANLELKRSAAALEDAGRAQHVMGNSGPIELALATADRQLHRLNDAETHYRAALRYTPTDITLWLALADTLYEGRHFTGSIDALNEAIKLDAHDPLIYAELAHDYAQLRQKDNTLRAIQQAESEGGDQAGVLLATGDAMLTLGNRKAALQRFGRALNAPDANRVDVRLALARLFASEGRFEDAKQQISLGFSDARIGESTPVTADNMIVAGNLFLYMHDYELAGKFYDRARQAGAPEQQVALGEANTYLAQGDSTHAEAALAAYGNPAENLDDYDYQIALATYYQQKNDLSRSMVAFARASQLSTNPADFSLLDSARYTAAQHGLNLTQNLTVASDTSFSPIFEDSTIYALDAKLLSTGGATLPPPRANYEIRQTTGFRYAPDGWVPITASWQVRDARGKFSYPALNQIINRNTVDTSLAAGVNPVLHFGQQRVSLDGGLEFTIRRDTLDPIALNENLLRPYLFVETSPLFNWLTVRANGFRESGPFTLQKQNSKEYFGKIEFQVGRPWGHTSLITGYTADDLQFRPLIREFFTTSTYAGLQHKFGQRLTVTGLAEIVRSWRVQDTFYATSQALAPGANIDARLKRNWSLNAFGTWQSNKTIGAYDNVQSGFFISYTRPLSQTVNDGFGAVPVEYPLKLSFGLQEESFMNFTGVGQTTVIRPVIRLTLF